MLIIKAKELFVKATEIRIILHKNGKILSESIFLQLRNK